MKHLLFLLIAGLLLAGCTDEISPGRYVEPPEEYIRTDDYSTTRSFADTGDMDCDDFDTQDDAQSFFEDEGGPNEDYHNLDRDGDGVVCETLP